MVTDFGPTGTVFSKPVTVTVKYSPQYLTDNSIADPTTLKVVSMDAGVANETLGTTSQDTVNHTIGKTQMGVGIKQGGSFSNASATGSYKLVSYSFNATTPQPAMPVEPAMPPQPPLPSPLGFRNQLATITFDGAGGFTSSGTVNNDGTPGPASGSGTYTVATNGTFTTSDGTTGSVLAGGSTFVFASTSGNTVMGVGIKQGGSFSNASATGSYTLVSYSFNSTTPQPALPVEPAMPPQPLLPSPLGFRDQLATITFDGAGNFTSSGSVNSDGTSNAASGSGTYSIAADGTFTTSTGFTGSVLAGGSTFVFANTSGNTVMGVGIRK
jgi:hypothetical protein